MKKITLEVVAILNGNFTEGSEELGRWGTLPSWENLGYKVEIRLPDPPKVDKKRKPFHLSLTATDRTAANDNDSGREANITPLCLLGKKNRKTSRYFQTIFSIKIHKCKKA